MSVEVEFMWPLDTGKQVHVTAAGLYHTDTKGIWPVELGFSTDTDVVGNAHQTLAQITVEMSMIQDHAIAMLIDKAQEELKESA